MRTKVKREFIGDDFGMLVVCSVLIMPLNREENESVRLHGKLRSGKSVDVSVESQFRKLNFLDARNPLKG